MPDDTPPAWLADAPEWVRDAINRTADGKWYLAGVVEAGWVRYWPGNGDIQLDGYFPAAQLRDLAAMMEAAGDG